MTTSGDGDRPVLVVLAAGMAKRYGGCKPLAPLGLHGEAVIDLIAGDAVAAGFGDIVLVLGSQTGPAIRYHVRRCFPSRLDVSFTEQPVPLGTAHAVLCARKHVGDGSFAVVNADDVYGAPAMALLARELTEGDEHAIVSYRLRDTIVADAPVTRGVCEVGPDGHLRRLVERRAVQRRADGDFDIGDGLEPGVLPGDTPVSMNLWGFHPSIWPVLEAAVLRTHPSVSPDGAVPEPSALGSEAEVLLPEVVGDMIAGRTADTDAGAMVRVLDGPGRCIGVTHADDLPAVRNELALMVAQGLRPEGPWDPAT
jgi:CTP:molybdopterin cytidylyltransferase MocA